MQIRFQLKHSIFALLLMCFAALQLVGAQNMDKIERDRMKDILNNLKKDIKKEYYDPEFRGIDIDARFEKAKERLDQVATTSQALAVIAQALVDFNDSHLYFIPPPTNLRVEYGWRIQMIGDKCFVTTVKPGSDGDSKGLKAGDQILAIEGFKPSRNELWKVLYYYNSISIRQKLNLTVLSPGATEPRNLEVRSELKKLPRAITFQSFFRFFDDFDDPNSPNFKHLFQNIGNVLVWRMPGFDFNPGQVDNVMERVRKSSALILDLRGNGGGYVVTMERLAGFFFDKDIKIAELKGRKKMDPQIAKSQGKGVFPGKVIVLVDSRSGSASEIFARLMQLEKRGQVLGDVSAGAVMQSRVFNGELGTSSIVLYGSSITNADVIMSDGKSLEHVGVQPDELILPTAEDIARQRDPVMVRALEILGNNITADSAGKFFPYVWSK